MRACAGVLAVGDARGSAGSWIGLLGGWPGARHVAVSCRYGVIEGKQPLYVESSLGAQTLAQVHAYHCVGYEDDCGKRQSERHSVVHAHDGVPQLHARMHEYVNGEKWVNYRDSDLDCGSAHS